MDAAGERIAGWALKRCPDSPQVKSFFAAGGFFASGSPANHLPPPDRCMVPGLSGDASRVHDMAETASVDNPHPPSLPGSWDLQREPCACTQHSSHPMQWPAHWSDRLCISRFSTPRAILHRQKSANPDQLHPPFQPSGLWPVLETFPAPAPPCFRPVVNSEVALPCRCCPSCLGIPVADSAAETLSGARS